MWAPIGGILFAGLVWRQGDLVAYSSELHVWAGLLALVGGFLGALVGVGGGVFSGLVTGALIGYFGWLAAGDPAGVAATAAAGSVVDVPVLVVLGTCVGMVGGLVGGLVTGVAGTKPAQGDGQVRAGVLLGILSLLAFALLTVLVIRDPHVVAEVIDFSLAEAGSIYTIPEPKPEPFVTFGGGAGALVVVLVLVAFLPVLAEKDPTAEGRAVAGFLRQMQLNLWRALLPLCLGLLCEVVATQAIGSVTGEARVGVGALLGVGVASGLQEWMENRSEEEGARRSRSGTVVWAAVIAAIVITAVQGYLFPAL